MDRIETTILLFVIFVCSVVSVIFLGARASANDKETSAPPIPSMSDEPTIKNGLIKEGSLTYDYVDNVKQTGFQSLDGNVYYFDPTSQAKVGEMRPMTGTYWRDSSMLEAYPDLKNYSKISISVDLKTQRAFIKSNEQVIYVMYISSGLNNSTPIGNFKIGSRGATFFNPKDIASDAPNGEGANYWTALVGKTSTGKTLPANVYLFHSIPISIPNTDDYMVVEGEKLGKEPGSHGCIRLSIADAKWLNANIAANTPVSIQD